MTYVVTEACIKCKYMDCVEVCPVDCFYEGENMLVINPDECIDCGVCEPECPPEGHPARHREGPGEVAGAQSQPVRRVAEHHPQGRGAGRRRQFQGRKRQVRQVFQQQARQNVRLTVCSLFDAVFATAMRFRMGRPLPKCNIARDSGRNSGIRVGLEAVRGPVRRWLGVLVGIRKQLTDTGIRVEHAGERVRWVAVSLNAGFRREGT